MADRALVVSSGSEVTLIGACEERSDRLLMILMVCASYFVGDVIKQREARQQVGWWGEQPQLRPGQLEALVDEEHLQLWHMLQISEQHARLQRIAALQLEALERRRGSLQKCETIRQRTVPQLHVSELWHGGHERLALLASQRHVAEAETSDGVALQQRSEQTLRGVEVARERAAEWMAEESICAVAALGSCTNLRCSVRSVVGSGSTSDGA